jgi:hypothetical protein
MEAEYVTTGVRRTLGGVYRAPLGTEIPEDASSTLGASFVEQGFISEDGVTFSHEFESVDIREWGGQLVRRISTSRDVTCTLKAIETENIDVLKSIYGDNNVTGTLATGLTVVDNDTDPGESVWVIDMIGLEGTLKRIVLPRATISDLGDEVYKRDEVAGYEVTLTALPDEDGVKMYEYLVAADSE